MLRSQRRRRRNKRPNIINSLKRKAGQNRNIDLTRLLPIPLPKAPQSSNNLDMVTLRRAQPEVSARKRRKFLELVNSRGISGMGAQTFSEMELQRQDDEMRNQERRRELDKITRDSDEAIAANKARLNKLKDEEKISIKAIKAKTIKSLKSLRNTLTKTSRHKKSKLELPPADTPSETVSESVTPQSVTPQSVSPQSVTPQSVTPQSVLLENALQQNASLENVSPLQIELSPKTMKRRERLQGRIRRRLGNQDHYKIGGKISRKRRK